MSKPFISARILLIAGLGAVVALALLSSFFPEARALLLGGAIAIGFLAIAMSLVAQILGNIQASQQSASDPLKAGLLALQEGLQALPIAFEQKLETLGNRLTKAQAEGLKGLSEGLGEKTAEGLKQGALAMGQSIESQLKGVNQALPPLIDSLKAQVESLNQAQAQIITRFQESQQQGLQALLKSHQDLLQKSQLDIIAQTESNAQLAKSDRVAFLSTLEKQSESLHRLLSERALAQSEENQALLAQSHQVLSAQADTLAKAVLQAEVSWQKGQEHLEAVFNREAKATEAWQQILKNEIGTLLGEKAEALIRSHQNLLTVNSQNLAALEATFFEKTGVAHERAESLATQAGEALASAAKRLQELEMAQASMAEKTGSALQSQFETGAALSESLLQLTHQIQSAAKHFNELENLSRINQTELQGGISMLNSALGNLLDRLEHQAQNGDSQQAFLSKLEAALAAYQERATDLLTENALKTQEILLEVLQSVELRHGSQSVVADEAV